MINEIIQLFEEEVTALSWVQRYGGLAKPVQIISQTGTPKTAAVAHYIGTPQKQDQTSLLQEKRYKFLVPDRNIKSIIYYEQPQPEVLVDGFGRQNYCRYETTIKLIGWLNLKKIGVEETTIKGKCMQHIISIFNNRFWGDTDSTRNATTKNITPDNAEATLNLFSKYSYADKQFLHFYPYEVFSINIPVRYTIYTNCKSEINISNIDCVKYEN